jgi:hypothetical protein
MLNEAFFKCYVECLYAECLYAECRGTPYFLSLEEVGALAGHKVLMKVEYKHSLIVGDPQGI